MNGRLLVTNSEQRWVFAFDYGKILARFEEQTRGAVNVLLFDHFITGEFVGSGLLNNVIGHDAAKQTFWPACSKGRSNRNDRLSTMQVELLYFLNFLGVNRPARGLTMLSIMFLPIVLFRVRQIKASASSLKRRFNERYPVAMEDLRRYLLHK